MKLNTILEKVAEVFGRAKVSKKRSPVFTRLDRGVLEVAMMVAALDGTIQREEYQAFKTMAKMCRGYSEKSYGNTVETVTQNAGALMAMAQIGEYSENDRIALFVMMAVQSLPNGFELGSIVDIRRAFALWVAMGVADGDFNDVERQSIAALADHFTNLKFAKSAEIDLCWASMCSGYHRLSNSVITTRNLNLLEDDFIDKAERIVRDLSVASRREKAEAQLVELIGDDSRTIPSL